MKPAPSSAPTRLRAAFVRRVHGVHGEVRAEPCGGDVSRFAPGTQLLVEGSATRLTVRSARPGGDGSVLLAFEEIALPEAAEPLRGSYLEVDTAAARPLGADEWFTWQLSGLTVVDTVGRNIGTVSEVEPSVANDVLVVSSGGMVRRFPMVHAFVKKVDLEAGLITLDVQDEVDA